MSVVYFNKIIFSTPKLYNYRQMAERTKKTTPKESGSIETQSAFFLNFMGKIRSGTIDIDIEDYTNESLKPLGMTYQAEKLNLVNIYKITMNGNNSEKMKILKSVIDDYVLSIGGHVGILTDDGDIEERPLKLTPNKQDRKRFSSTTAYLFGLNAEEVLDKEEGDNYGEPLASDFN